ncbi:MAG: hypothetical protein KDD34_01635 [Bdellovibrionales bacterium]|nr:hypothetical protein [Bdellovibrionales bacterium]
MLTLQKTIFFLIFTIFPTKNLRAQDSVKCHLDFKELGICAYVNWPDPPLTFVANNFELLFYEKETLQPIALLPKLEITVYNFFEDRWTPSPDIGIPKDTSHLRYVNNLFFDKPGYWILFIHLITEDKVSKAQIKLHLEDYGIFVF